MFHRLFKASDKMGGSGSKDEVRKSDRLLTKLNTKLGSSTKAGPFGASDSSTNILICNGLTRGWQYDDDGSANSNSKDLEAIKKDYGDNKARIVSQSLFRHEIHTSTLTLSGLEVIAMSPRQRFSRMRNFEADSWEDQAYLNADAFVYSVQLDGEEYFQRRWERDRFQIANLLRKPSLIENPRKPLLLLVNSKEEDEYDVERLVNLFGLGGHKFQRPFRAVSYSTAKSDTNHGILKESLEWLAKTARSSEDEVTTITGSDTEDEGSVGTSASTLTNFSTMSTVGGGHFVLDYEPTLLGGNPTLQRFEPIKKRTHCPFARAAKLWGGKVADEFKPRLMGRVDPLQEAASLNAGPLAEFVARSNNGEPLDGFCIEIPYPEYTVEKLGERVRLLLTKLAELDPTPGENAMTNMGTIDHPHWRFCFAGEDFFLTTFSPVYGKDSSRHSFGVNRDFLLFQPMTSFGRHGLTEDTPASATNWDQPSTMCDKARVAFKTSGCPYHIPEKLPYPVAEHVVKPEKDDGTICVRWWEPLEAKKQD